MRTPKSSFEITDLNFATLIFIGIIFLVIASMAFLISGGMELKLIILLIGIIASAICFFNTEMALYLVLFSMLFSPEFSFGGGLAEGRSLVIRVEDIIILIVFSSWMVKTALYEGVGLIVKTPLNQPIRLYVFASLFSTLLGAIFGRVGIMSGLLYVFKYMEYFLVFFMFVNNIRDKDQISRFIIASIIVAIFTAIYASVQIPMGVRVSAPFEGESGEPNTLGGYLILIISVAGGLWFAISDKKIKTYLLAIIALLTIPFIFTLSRSSWVAAIPMFIVFFFLTGKRVLLVSLLLVFIALAPIVLPKEVKDRVTSTFVPDPNFKDTEVIGDIGFDSSTSARISSFKYSIRKWKERPVFGWGITGVGIIDSMYFRLLAETGAIGLLAFLYLVYTTSLFLFNTFRGSKDPLLKGLSLGMLAGTAALLGHSIGAASFIIVRIMEPYWFFMAAIVTLSDYEKGDSLKVDKAKAA
jgi:O-antigen ligase